MIIEHEIPYNNVKRVCSPSEEYASRYAIGNGPGRSLGVSKKSVFEGAPSDEGKRRDVTGVNDSPVDCQSRDANRRNDLSAKLTGGEMQKEVSRTDGLSAKSDHLLPLSRLRGPVAVPKIRCSHSLTEF